MSATGMDAAGVGGPRVYEITHRTRYRYLGDVEASYGLAHLMPRPGPGQTVDHAEVIIEPRAAELREHLDHFGNPTTYYAVRSTHRELTVAATSRVRVDRARDLASESDLARPGAQSWDSAVGRAAPADQEYLLASTHVRLSAAVRDYAARTFTPGRPLGAALRDLLARIHAEFRYESGATTIGTPLGELLHRRAGVCQDFAHLAVACLRSVGLPARYVSGYLETQPPPGQPKLQGADASHAWASLYVPDHGWLDLDPTNNRFVDNGYVTTAWGRDYADVPPVKGIIMTEATSSSLSVGVDVTRLG